MTAHLVLMIFWSVWTFNLGQCDVATEISDITQSSSNSDMNDPQIIFTNHFRKIIESIYRNSFDNFIEIIYISEISDDTNFKADVLLGLNDAMSKAHHTEILLHAIKLYNKIEAFLNENTTNVYPKKLEELLGIREGLLLSTIVPKASRILESVVYVTGCSLQGTPVEKLFKMLLSTNETVSSLTFNKMVAKVRWTLPVEELTTILAYFSPYPKQNVDILLALYDEDAFQETEKEIIAMKLAQLVKHSYYTVTPETQRKINAMKPLQLSLQNLFTGLVCFYQELSNGNRSYIYECESSDLICVNESQQHVVHASFIAEMKENPLVFTFRSRQFHNRVLAIKFHEFEQLEDVQYDLYSLDEAVEPESFSWKVQLKGEQVVLQNLNGTKFLCVDDEDRAYVCTRNQTTFFLHRDECKWFVEDCS